MTCVGSERRVAAEVRTLGGFAPAGIIAAVPGKQVGETARHRVTASRQARRLAPGLAVALAALVVFVFAPVRTFDFVSWDDPWYITRNANVAGGLTWQSAAWAFTAGAPSYWHPVTWLSHLADVEIYGLDPGGHHVTNVLLHAANTLLLFGLLRRLTGRTGRSAFVAALFAIHPLRVESVAWVSERKDVLSALFWMLTLRAYVWYVREPRARRYVVVLLLFVLGLMAKPMIVTLPIVLLLLDWWPLNRIGNGASAGPGLSRGATSRSQWAEWWPLVREKLPLLGAAAAAGVVTIAVQAAEGAVAGFDLLPPSARVAHALLGYVTYIRRMFWPAGLAAFYPYVWNLPPWWVLVSAAAGLAVVTALVVRLRGSRPALAFGWFWYLLTLVPVAGLVQSGAQSSADRFTYIPLVGLFVMVAWGVPALVARWRPGRTMLPLVAVLVVLAFAAASRQQVYYWKDSFTLWSRALEVTAGNHRAHAGLAEALAGEGRLDEAVAHYREATRLLPGVAEWHNDLGVVLTRQGLVAEAAAEYEKAVLLRPRFVEARNNLGAMLARQGRTSEAVAQYTEALRIDPDNALARQNLGLALADQGRLDDAIRECLAALRLEPDNAGWHYQVAFLFYRKSDISGALRHLERALEIEPGNEAARRARDELVRQESPR